VAVPPLANTFESGQADGTAITTANSGGAAGDAFSAVTGAPPFSTAHAKSGSLAMKFDTTATFAQKHVDWTGFGIAADVDVWYRVYLYISANPASGPRLFCVRKSSPAGNSAFISITTAGKVQGMNAAQSGVATGTVSVALNQWVRIEFRVRSSTTIGQIEWWLYNTPDAPLGSHDDTASATGLVLGANTDGIMWGPNTVTGPANWVGWLDDPAVSTSGQIGPASSSQSVAVSGLASAASFGTLTLLPGPVSIGVNGVGSAAGFGTPQENILFAVSGVPSAAAFGTPSVTVGGGGGQIVPVSGLGSAQAFGSPTPSPGPVVVAVAGVPTAQQFAPITANQLLHVAGVPSAAAFGTPTPIPGPTSVPIPGLGSAGAFGAEQVSGGTGPTFSPAIHGGKHHH
jgi:hypothetical protein